MSKLSALAAATFLAGVCAASAEPNRTLFVNENRAPELGQAEVGVMYFDREYDMADETEWNVYARYGLIENLTAKITVPYLDWENDFGASADGIGDVVLGFNLLAYEDIFHYPYVIPHLDISFPTGDEDDGLGSGETSPSFGVSVGTVTYDQLHWIVDASYVMNGGSELEDPEDIVVGSLALIWDVSDRFAIHGEVQISDDEASGEDNPVTAVGGMTYEWSRDVEMSVYGGGGDVYDSVVGVKAAYTF